MLEITSYGYFLALTITSATSACQTTGGLCGNCDGDRNNDFQTGPGLYISHSNINTVIINTDFVDYWRSSTNPGFIYAYPDSSFSEPIDPASLQHGLWFSNTTCASDALFGVHSEVHPTITLEVRFKITGNLDGKHIVLGYSKDHAVAIVCQHRKLFIQLDGTLVDVGLDVSGVWQHVSLVYDRVSGDCTVNVIGADGRITTATVHIGLGLFTKDGHITLGTAQSSTIVGQFVGIIDSVRIWRRHFNIYEALMSSRTMLDSYFADLDLLWNFNEGTGYKSTDIIHTISINIPSANGPSWVISDGSSMISHQPTLPFTDQLSWFTDNDPELTEQCTSLIQSLASSCTSLGSSFSDFMFLTCLREVYHSPDVSSVLSTVNAYSYHCKVINNNPNVADEMCGNNVNLDDSSACVSKDLCRFGELTDEECVCHGGYWGSDCSEVCPVGTHNPCNSHGHCVQTSGLCMCESTWDAATNCMSCSGNWTGDDCSLLPAPSVPANSPTPEYMYGGVHGIGQVETFKGSSFKLGNRGEFYLIHSNSGIKVEIRVGTCCRGSLCVEAVAIYHQDDTIVIRAGYYRKHLPIIWHNNVKIISMDIHTAGMFRIHHKSTFVITVTGTGVDRFEMSINQVHRYLTMSLSVAYSLCVNQQSLLGDCDISKDESIDSSGLSSVVPPSESLFGVLFAPNLYNEMNVTSGGGYSLHLDGKTWIAVTEPGTTLRPLQDITLEFHINPDVLSGVVLTYRTGALFSVYINSTLMVWMDGRGYDTGLRVTLHVWQHIVISWNWQLRQFTVHLIDDAGNMHQSTLVITHTDVEVFHVGGQLVVGYWYDKHTMFTDSGLVGQFDEFRIWHRLFTYQDVLVHVRVNIVVKVPGLVACWKFDEGEGYHYRDLIGTTDMVFVIYENILHIPRWRCSYAHLDVHIVNTNHYFTNSALESEAETRCSSLLVTSTLSTDCLNTRTQTIMYSSCMQDVAAGRHIDVSLHVLLYVSDVCQQKGLVTYWPARDLCSLFPSGEFPIYISSTGNCDVECRFGEIHDGSIGQCRCYDGYWGVGCDRICPGGPLNGCNGKGLCGQSTGVCDCEDIWQGDTDCSTCTPGHVGSDCSLIAAETSTTSTASISVGGFWRCLDGSSFVFKHIGIYSVLASVDIGLEIQVGQTSCDVFGTCLTLIGCKMNGQTIVFDLGGDAGHRLFVGGSDTQIHHTNDIQLGGGYSYRRRDWQQYEIHGPIGFFMVITIQRTHFDISLKVTNCEGLTGIVTPCTPQTHSCPITDHLCIIRAIGLLAYSSQYTLHHELISSYCAHWSTGFDVSLFVDIDVIAWYTQTGVVLDNTVITSERFACEFDQLELSVEISLIIDLVDGVIFSYLAEKEFVLAIYDGNLCVHYDSITLVTDIVVDIDHPCLVNVCYTKVSGVISIGYVSSVGVRVWTGGLPAGCFPHGGFMHLGGARPGRPSFRGTFISVIAWNKPLSPAEIYFHQHVRLPSVGTNIVLSIPISEGHSYVTRDIATGILFYVPNDNIWKKLRHPSYNPGYIETSYCTCVYYPDDECKQVAETSCQNLLQLNTQNTLWRECLKLTMSVSITYQQCLTQVGLMGTPSLSINAVLSFSQTCQDLLELPTCPAQFMCNEFDDQNFPLYIGTQCDKECVFGEADPDDPEVCVCETGYWGAECDQVCPGGVDQPCGGHGVCTPAGTCHCEINWLGKSQVMLYYILP